jgi:hypothetical protein
MSLAIQYPPPGGVSSLNNLVGVLTLEGASGITISNAGNIITIAANGAVPSSSIIGTTTNDNAAPGYVGEYMNAQQLTPQNAGTSTVFMTVVSLLLTPGDWDVWGLVDWSLNGSTTSFVRAGLNAGSLTNGINVCNGPAPSGYNTTLPLVPVRISTATNQSVVLQAAAAYSAGTPQYIGSITARRVR